MVGVYINACHEKRVCTHREFRGNEIHVAALGKRIRQEALLGRNFLLASELPSHVASRQRKFIRRLLTRTRYPAGPEIPPLIFVFFDATACFFVGFRVNRPGLRADDYIVKRFQLALSNEFQFLFIINSE